ncbi:MAG: DUF2231 domain-containing protein [Candidatus Sericytochromatia bacterium]|nr:DUF2231 domain-containing protein [Candidatus Sericytochromatia bacterium]
MSLTLPLHPLVVHLPLALVVVVAGLDLAALAWPRLRLARMALGLQAIATLGALGAYVTGDAAEHAVEHLPGIEPFLERHEALGLALLIGAGLVLAVRGALVWRGLTGGLAGRAVAAALGVGLAGLAAVTGHAGGVLVYEHGAGVKPGLVIPAAPAHGDENHAR